MNQEPTSPKQEFLISAIITSIAIFMNLIVGSVVCYALLTGRLFGLKGSGLISQEDPVALWIFTALHAAVWAGFIWSMARSVKNTMRLKREARQ